MLKTFLQRLSVLLGAQVAMFGAITGYDELTGGAVHAWLMDRGWPIHIVIVLYWLGPVVLYTIGETLKVAVPRSLRFLAGWYWRWKLGRAVHLHITAREILVAVSRAESRGLLSKDEARVLERAARDLEPIEFEILVLFDDPTGWAKKHGIQYPQWATASRSQLLEFAIPSFKRQRQHYNHFIRRLQAKRLLLLGPDALSIVLSRSELLRSITTPLGHKLAYLKENVRTK